MIIVFNHWPLRIMGLYIKKYPLIMVVKSEPDIPIKLNPKLEIKSQKESIVPVIKTKIELIVSFFIFLKNSFPEVFISNFILIHNY